MMNVPDYHHSTHIANHVLFVHFFAEGFPFNRACLIYGALPPETRRQQARLFNETDNEYDVLVASDAVGMGLNLNIRRIIFTTLVKNLGGKKKAISTSEIKQIAGMCSLSSHDSSIIAASRVLSETSNTSTTCS